MEASCECFGARGCASGCLCLMTRKVSSERSACRGTGELIGETDTGKRIKVATLLRPIIERSACINISRSSVYVDCIFAALLLHC